jgi:predicted PurR-regulated permease PerM
MQNKDSSDKLITIQRQLVIFVLALTASIIIFQIGAYFADILRILAISILFSYLFIALVDQLNKYLKSRILAVSIVYAIVLIGIVFSAVTLVPTVISQVSQLLNSVYQQLPKLVQNLTEYLVPVEHRLRAAQIEIRTADLVNGLIAVFPRVEAGQIFNRVSDVAVSTMTGAIYGLSILLMSFYFLLDGYKMQGIIIQLFPGKHQKRLQSICKEIDQSLQAFFRGQVIMALGFGCLMIIIYYILGVHYALLLGIILAIWEIIPVIGPPIGFMPTIFSVVFDGMDNIPVNRLTQVLLIFILFNGLQWVKDNLIGPKYIGNVIGLHPVLIFLAIIIGAKIDGWLGIVFALPAACTIHVLAKNIYADYSMGFQTKSS